MRNICLLLTSTIEVQNKSLVKRSDTRTRLEDYKQALKKWLTKQNSLDKIVFAENSGYPLDELKKIVADYNLLNKEVEFVSFKYSGAGDKDISMGEIRSIEYALSHSRLLERSEKFAKVTGRVFVKNIDSIMSSLHEDFHVVARLSENLMCMDSVLGIFDLACYKKVINDFVISEMNSASERIDFESVYARAIHLALSINYRWYPLPEEFVLDGMSGTKNISYGKRYNARRALLVNFIARQYHKFFRNAYSKKEGREHLLSRWNIEPKT